MHSPILEAQSFSLDISTTSEGVNLRTQTLRPFAYQGSDTVLSPLACYSRSRHDRVSCERREEVKVILARYVRLIYAFTIAIAYPILLVPLNSMTYDIIGRAWKAAEARIEYIVVLELFTNAGRVVSILLFIFAITFFNKEQSIPILLLFIGAGHLCISLFIRKIHTNAVE